MHLSQELGKIEWSFQIPLGTGCLGDWVNWVDWEWIEDIVEK